jgi:hypothetical protein
MHAGHTSLKASLNDLTVPTAKCKCGDAAANGGTYLLELLTVRGPTGNNDGHSV